MQLNGDDEIILHLEKLDRKGFHPPSINMTTFIFLNSYTTCIFSLCILLVFLSLS